MRTSWPTLEDFWREDIERERSPECDYGVHWAGPGEGRPGAWPLWRVSYLQYTGEVVAVCQMKGCPVALLGVVPPDEDTRQAEGYGRGKTYYETLDGILEGWAELDSGERELTWVTGRLAVRGMAVMGDA